MSIKLIRFLLLLEIIHIAYTNKLGANKLIQDICDTLQKNNSLQVDEDRQWEIICQELFDLKDNDQHITTQDQDNAEQYILQNKLSKKAAIRFSSIRTGSRTSVSGSRGSSSSSSSGSRTPSITRYSNTRTGTTLSRPTGWLWSGSRFVFLPLARRYGHRSSSSSSRFTTPSSSGTVNYYYCTSNENPSTEIQCSSIDGDTQCCEDDESQQAYCCGGNIPNYITQDMNRATQTIAKILYTLTALALCMHLFMRRFNR
ncbi:unnamed protein product [Adineta steineri]|uniref:Uncharacterized protein n=1 Tax=Adineta steineri TaxID=433720 RepID=A0A815MSX7_9BILA|nr:unnamed protein product [Adineta steineri]